MIATDVRINFLLTQNTAIETGQLLGAIEANEHLVKLRLYLRWLKIFFLLRVGVVLDLDLLIASATDSD